MSYKYWKYTININANLQRNIKKLVLLVHPDFIREKTEISHENQNHSECGDNHDKNPDNKSNWE